DPTTSISGAAVPTEKACETTRIAGAAAWGAPVGIGSGVRTSVVAVGSAVGVSVGVAVGVAVWVGAPVAVGELLALGVAAGPGHAQITATASASAGHLRIAVIPLRVALGNGSADIHSVSQSDRRQRIGLDATTLDRRTQIIEISNHRRGRVQVQLAAWDATDAEAVLDSGGYEDERAGWARVFASFDEQEVLALEYVEGLGRVTVNVQRRTEARRLVGLEQRERATRVLSRRLHGHPESAEIDRPSAARPQDECVAHISSARPPFDRRSAGSPRALVGSRSASGSPPRHRTPFR